MDSLYEQLPPDHIVRVLAEEHDVLLHILARLSTLSETVARAEPGPLDERLVAHLGELADGLLAAEPHHQREEDVLFPVMEEMGIEGPPHVMRMEHVELRREKRALRVLADRAGTEPVESWRAELAELSPRLVGGLSSHIGKENEVLYPMALSHLDASVWADMQAAAAAIGPCAFPRAA